MHGSKPNLELSLPLFWPSSPISSYQKTLSLLGTKRATAHQLYISRLRMLCSLVPLVIRYFARCISSYDVAVPFDIAHWQVSQWYILSPVVLWTLAIKSQNCGHCECLYADTMKIVVHLSPHCFTPSNIVRQDFQARQRTALRCVSPTTGLFLSSIKSFVSGREGALCWNVGGN